MNLVLLEPNEVSDFGEVKLTGARADHLVKVLKVAPGQAVRFGIVDGPCGIGTVQSVTDGTVELRHVANTCPCGKRKVAFFQGNRRKG